MNGSPTFETREGYFDISMEISINSNSQNSIHTEVGSCDLGNANNNDLDILPREEKDLTDYFPLQIDPRPTTDKKGTCYDARTEEIQVKTKSERILEAINRRAPPHIIRRILKCSIAYFLSTLFSTIYPVAVVLGNVPFVTSTGCLLCHPGRTMGAQFDATLTAALGAALAIVYGLAGVAAASTYNINNPDSYAGAAINCTFLVIGIFGAQLLRQVFPKLSVFSLQFMIVQLFTLTISVNSKEIPMDLSSQFGLCLVIGNFISLIVNLVLWPETAVDSLGRSLIQTLSDSKEMLDTITKQFFLDPKSDPIPIKVVDELSNKIRQGRSKIDTAYHEAKYEISYAYSSSSDLNQMRISLYKITKHLRILGGSLKKRQIMFKNNDFFAFHDESSDFEQSDDPHAEASDNGKSSTQGSTELPDDKCNSNIDDSKAKHGDLRQSALEATAKYIESGEYLIPNAKIFDTDDTNGFTPSSSSLNYKENRDTETTIQFEYPTIVPRRSSLNTPNIFGYNDIIEDEKTDNNNTTYPGRRRSLLSSLWSSFTDLSSSAQKNVPDTVDPHSESEYDYTESNQHSTSSFKSFLKLTGLSATKPKVPERVRKKIGSNEKRFLEIYLETLRNPILSLAVECSSVLDCIRDSLADQLDLPIKKDAGISHNGFWRYMFHVLKIKTIRDKNYHTKHFHQKERRPDFICDCAEKIRLQIIEFDKCERNRLQALYKLNISHMEGSLNGEIRECLFLVFFFIFSMREVAMELQDMAQNIRNLQLKTQTEIQSNPNQSKKKKKFYMPRITIQTWRKWFHSNNHQNVKDRGGYTYSYLYSNMPTGNVQKNAQDEYDLAHFRMSDGGDVDSPGVNLGERMSGVTNENNDKSLRKRDAMTRHSIQEKNYQLYEVESGFSTGDKTTEKKIPPLLKFRYRLWLCVRYIQGYNFKFALKTCFAVGVLTMPVYIPGYYDWYNAIRGQWAALTVIMVMSPTSGGTLSSGLWRLVGTLVGAFTAWAILEIDGNSGYLLSGFSFFFALPSFYIHFSTSYSKVAIITLTTYIVIAMGQYLTPNYYETVSERVWLRTGTLVVGLVTALILNWMVWPFIARDTIRQNLGNTISDLGDYYSYILGTFLYHDEKITPTDVDYEKAIKMEKKLEKMCTTCSELLKLTDHEPRLKGPFPKEFYKCILDSAQNLLDCMISLRVALMKMTPDVKKTIRNLDKYRHKRDMVASILLHFYTISSSLKAKIPLPSYMPSARNARSKLLRHRSQEDRPEKLLRYRNLTWSAMACITEEIIDELEHLTDLVRFIVGESKFSYMARRLENQE